MHIYVYEASEKNNLQEYSWKLQPVNWTRHVMKAVVKRKLPIKEGCAYSSDIFVLEKCFSFSVFNKHNHNGDDAMT